MEINLALSINTSKPLTEDIFKKWLNVAKTLADKHVVKIYPITPVIAEKYKFDFHGLLQNECGISYEHIVPNMLINGYNSSDSYDGKLLDIKLLDPTILTKYYILFTK